MKNDRTVRAERRRIWWASLNQATRTIILIGVVVVLVMLGIWIKSSFFTKKEPEITSEFINGKLDVVSELASAEMTYTGIVRYEDGTIEWDYSTDGTFLPIDDQRQAMIDAAIQREIDRKVTRAAMKAKQASILNAMLCCLI